MRRITVLFTAACGWPTHSTCEALKRGSHAEYTIVGVDCSPRDTARNYVDYLYGVPRCGEDGYCESVLRVCERHGVDLVVPLISEEITILHKNSGMFEERGIRLPWTGSDGLFEIANDKLLAMRYLEERGMRAFPKTLELRPDTLDGDLELLGHPGRPVAVKLRDGCGAVGFKILDDESARKSACSASRDSRDNPYISTAQLRELAGAGGGRYLLQEYLPGREVGTMCLVDHGRTVYSPSHENFEMQYATATYCELVDCGEASEIASEANRILGLNGNIGYDFKRDGDGRLRLLEINPRISATVALAAKAGLNLVEYGILQGMGIPYPEDVEPLYGLRMQRVYGTLYSYGGMAYGT